MATKTTRWSPDTCDCIVEYTWDDAVASDQRVHTIASVINRCAEHAAINVTGAPLWRALIQENPNRNMVIQELITRFPALTRTRIDQNGDSVVELDPAKIPTFTFERVQVGDGRRLVITTTRLTQPQKNTLQTAFDTRFGVGRVLVQ